MSPAFIAGPAEHFAGVLVTFDRYHLMQDLNFALDQVRRANQAPRVARTLSRHSWQPRRRAALPRSTLKYSRFLWPRNPDRLSERQRAQIERLSRFHDKTGRAYRIKVAFHELYTKSGEEAEDHLRRWYAWAIRSRLTPIVEFAKTVKQH